MAASLFLAPPVFFAHRCSLSSTTKSLQFSEWILVSSVLLLLTSFVVIAQCHAHRRASQLKIFLDAVESMATVSIDGAVLKPGSYSVSLGTCLGDVIKKSRPKRFADLRSIDTASLVNADLSLSIGELSMIRVHVLGSGVGAVDLEVPAGTRVCDLKSKIQCSPMADRSALKSRRLLKDGEEICIPEKGLDL